MGNLGETLMEELNCETVFSIGGIGIAESVVVTWIIMAVVVAASILLTRNLKVEHPGRGQLMLEYAVTWLQGIGKGIVGEEGEAYASYLTSVLTYVWRHQSPVQWNFLHQSPAPAVPVPTSKPLPHTMRPYLSHILLP